MADPKQQASIERMRRFDIRPRRKLGQNFLIDNNILDVISTAADLHVDDVVLEVGGGLGVLSEFLAARVSKLQVIEIDNKLSDALDDAVGGFENVLVHYGDAVDIDFGELDPKPTKLIANLPYNVAATCVIKAFYELPALELCCVMAQREVGERLTAKPSNKLYAGTSVLVQAISDNTTTRKLSRNIFHPVPNVDSSLVTLKRTAENPPPEFNALVHGAFAHRRKPLAGSLALIRRGHDDADTIKQRAVAALAELGYDANTRAEQLPATDFLRLNELISEDRG